MPATQIHSQSTADIKRRQTWLETNWRREEGASERNNKPTLAILSFPSIYGNHWIIYKPLPLALCESECERERGDLLSSPPPCCVLLLSVQLLRLSGCWQCWAQACLFQLRTTQSQASASAATASTDRRLLREPLQGRC